MSASTSEASKGAHFAETLGAGGRAREHSTEAVQCTLEYKYCTRHSSTSIQYFSVEDYTGHRFNDVPVDAERAAAASAVSEAVTRAVERRGQLLPLPAVQDSGRRGGRQRERFAAGERVRRRPVGRAAARRTPRDQRHEVLAEVASEQVVELCRRITFT